MSSIEKITHSIGNLIKLLPTGTVFLFQFLSPLLTNNGHCAATNKYLTAALIAACGLSCLLASFTDSYVDGEGVTHYGIVTRSGLWPASTSRDLSSYKLRVGDFVHALCSLVVFGLVVLLDSNSVDCYYPAFGSAQKVLIMALPPVVAAAVGLICLVFPNNRHGIGYPSGTTTTTAAATTTTSSTST